ncbi:MAG: response regulator [Bdellovibrionales bacterium]
MDILIVDRDALASEMMRSKIEPLGHQVTVEPSKENAVETISKQAFDIVFLDPAPLAAPRQVIVNLRRHGAKYPYIVLSSSSLSGEDAIKAGANDLLAKPVDPQRLSALLENGHYMTSLVARIGDDSEDFPSAGGVIAKSAFNQLFLSAIERADRYAERSFIVFIAISNYKELVELDGSYAADYAVAKLSQYLVRLRRQSDIIGQTAKYEYALLLQRPVYETEPMEAANRFADALSQYDDIVSSGATKVEMSVTLVDLPVGSKIIEHKF